MTDTTKSSLIPTDSMTTEQKRAAQKARSSKYGIKSIENHGERLSFPAQFPTSLDEYGDPCNLLFPTSPSSRATNARVRFKQYAGNIYGDDAKSKRIVHTRIVEAELGYGSKPKYDDTDELDKMLPDATKKRMEGYTSSTDGSKTVDTGAIQAKVKKMRDVGVEPGDDYEPRVRFIDRPKNSKNVSATAKTLSVKIQKGKFSPSDQMPYDRISALVSRCIEQNYFLFGPFDPPRYDHDRPQYKVSVRCIFPNGVCIVRNYQNERNWKVSYKITPDPQGHYIAEIVGTPIPVEMDTLDSFKETAAVAKSVDANTAAFGEVSEPVVVKDGGAFSSVLGIPSVEVLR